MPSGKSPRHISIRSYQVGFGDCFMITFEYAAVKRHVLIDFGSMALPKSLGKTHMLEVAKQISKDSDGHIDIVVATHRHSDHISGFSTNEKGTAPGNIIAACRPKMVIQPWTENPRAPKNARQSDMTAFRAFTSNLNNMHAVADAATRTARVLGAGADRETTRQLTFLGQDNIKNRSAVDNLMTMAKNYYVKHGDKLPLAELLPGVKVHVLGPPSLKQSKAIAKQRQEDAKEFWQLQARAGTRVETPIGSLFPRLESRVPPYARWFRSRLRNVRAETMLSIVRILDKQMNNTSLILAFEIGDKVLLFPGDAQIENWEYTLSQPKFQTLLSKVNVYKVGHHGSRNATPRTLWRQFKNKGSARKSGRLVTLLSTLEGVHGHSKAKTEVPRTTLVSALKKNSDLQSTESFEGSRISRVVSVR